MIELSSFLRYLLQIYIVWSSTSCALLYLEICRGVWWVVPLSLPWDFFTMQWEGRQLHVV